MEAGEEVAAVELRRRRQTVGVGLDAAAAQRLLEGGDVEPVLARGVEADLAVVGEERRRRVAGGEERARL